MPGLANGIAVGGAYAYVADYADGLQVVRLTTVSNAAPPERVGAVDTPGSALGVAIRGTKAYVADGSAGLVAADISDPTHPFVLGIANTPGVAHHVAIAEPVDSARYAYIADGTSGLQVADITGDIPAIVGSVDTGSGDAITVAASGQYAFVADTGFGLVIVDASDPAHPAIASSVPTGNGTSGVAVQGSHVFVVNSLGLSIFDVADIGHPAMIGFVPLRYTVWPTVTVDGNCAYVGGPEHEFTLIDISDPAAPHVIGGIVSDGYPVRAAVADCTLYIADQMEGLIIAPGQSTADAPLMGVETSRDASRPALLISSPNPLIDHASLFFELPRPASVDIQVFDAAGRHVCRVFRGAVSGGRHVMRWNGRDDAGRVVASGTYFVRLQGDGGSVSERLVLLR